MNNFVSVYDIIVPKRHRAIKPYKLLEIKASIEDHGFNSSYPITLEGDEITLVDGRHRIEAAKQCSIERVPYVLKPDSVSSLAHSRRCNSDQTLGSKDDVFDLAEYCWGYAQDGWEGQDIAKELGWSETASVTNYKKIREKLHPGAWQLARNGNSANAEKESLANQDLATANWKESHFRALLKHLPWQPGDNATMRVQVYIIRESLARFANDGERVTATWIGELAETHAWHIKLKRYAIENLRHWVKARARIDLFRNINEGIFGNKPDNEAYARFVKAVESRNGKVPRLIVGRAEAMTDIEDKSIDVFITSPPYNLGADNWPMGGQGRQPRENGIGYQDMRPEEEYQKWQLECLKEMYRVAKSGASLFYNHKVRQKDGEMIHPLDWLRSPENPWILRQEIIWDRTSTHNHCPVYFWPHDERIYWMTKDEPILGGMWYKTEEAPEDVKRSTVWRFHGPRPGTWHPAPFPPELPRRCLQAVGRENIIVLDPFAGSCTTVKVAIEEFGFDAIGVDISKEYLDKAKEENGWTSESET